MKKIFLFMLIVINLTSFGQASKWFVSLSAAPTIGGPAASIQNQMVKQGYNQTSTFDFLGLSGSTQYPIVSKSASLLIRGGKKIKENKSLYFTAGISSQGSVKGFKNEGYSSFLGIFGGSYGDHVSVNYKAYQLTAGYLYSFPDTRAKLGFGPSIYLLNCEMENNYKPTGKHSSVVPGASFLARLPLGKEKKLFGVELFFEGNIALPAKLESSNESSFQPGHANMISANTGLAFSFRRK